MLIVNLATCKAFCERQDQTTKKITNNKQMTLIPYQCAAWVPSGHPHAFVR